MKWGEGEAVMNKRLFSILAAGALIASVFGAAPLKAAPEVPSDEDANIVDQPSDANYHSTATGSDAGPSLVAADIVKVWFTHDAETISTHIQTAGAAQPPWSLLYRVFVDPGAGSNCLQIRGFTGGAGNPAGEATGSIRDTCDGDTVIDGEFVQEEGPPVLEDGRASGLHTIIMQRDAHPAFSEGAVLATPEAETRHFTVAVTAPVVDDTEIGKDYTISGGDGGDNEAQPPGKNDPPGQGNQKCSKIKNKKKKKECKKNSGKQKGKNKNKPKACAAYQPGEMGAEVEEETTIVTDAATEEAPIELELDFAPAAGSWSPAPVDTTDHIFHNVQIDSEATEAGFWARLESPDTDDPDLYVYWDNGNMAAQAVGFNQAGLQSGSSHGGHSEVGAEQIDGIGTADCTGYTLDLVNWLGVGGTYTLKLWLGGIENEANPRDG